jgi:hypothetical protein
MHASLASESPGPAIDKAKSKDELQLEAERQEDTVSKAGGFDNDPDDPTNPNEVRERHLKKIKR